MTVRAHIYIVNNPLWIVFPLLISLVIFISCVPKKAKLTGKGEEKLKLTTLDVGGRGRTDTWRWTRPAKDGEKEVLVREEIDLNFDGRVDLHKTYDADKLSEQRLDLDFDGIMDRIESYEEGKLKKTAVSHTFSGQIDTWRFYEKEILVRVERDTNKDKKADEWMYYEKGKLKRTARDLNYDGVVDTWEE